MGSKNVSLKKKEKMISNLNNNLDDDLIKLLLQKSEPCYKIDNIGLDIRY